MAIKSLAILLIFSIILYLLYINGYVILGNKKALMYIGKNGFIDKKYSAKFSACTGEIKKVIKFRENRTYQFSFNCVLEKGEVNVYIRNSKKQNILVLNPENPVAVLDVEDKRYYLIVEMYKAYGKYELQWK